MQFDTRYTGRQYRSFYSHILPTLDLQSNIVPIGTTLSLFNYTIKGPLNFSFHFAFIHSFYKKNNVKTHYKLVHLLFGFGEIKLFCLGLVKFVKKMDESSLAI